MTDEEAVLAANAAYYRAFATSDMATLRQIWADDGVSCVHPGWPPLVGLRAILNSYHQIVVNPDQEVVEAHDASVLIVGDVARVLCIEVVSGRPLAAANWFRRIDGEWRMIHHQASPIAVDVVEESDPPQRLN